MLRLVRRIKLVLPTLLVVFCGLQFICTEALGQAFLPNTLNDIPEMVVLYPATDAPDGRLQEMIRFVDARMSELDVRLVSKPVPGETRNSADRLDLAKQQFRLEHSIAVLCFVRRNGSYDA